MRKTTLYLDDALHARLRREAHARGTSLALVIREALAAHRMRPGRRSKSLGLGRSGKGDSSARTDELLAGLGGQR